MKWPILATALAVLLFAAVGLALLRRHASSAGASVIGDAGTALLTGALVGGAFLAFQFWESAESESRSERQTIAMQRDLSVADLAGRDLHAIDLSGKDLDETDLSQTNLSASTMVRTSVKRARLAGADLRDSSARSVSFEGSFLTGVNASGIDGFDAHFEHVSAGPTNQGATANFDRAKLINGHFHGACLARASFKDAVLGGGDFSNAVLTGTDLTGAALMRDGVPANFRGALLTGVKVDPSGRALIDRARQSERARIAHLVGSFRTPGASPPNAIEDRLVEVSDGDTIKLEHLGWLRLTGIDAPDPTPPVEDLPRLTSRAPVADDPPLGSPDALAVGNLARTYLGRHIGEPVSYALAAQARERRDNGGVGRARGYLWFADGRFVNRDLLREGYVVRKSEPQDPALSDGLDIAQDLAQRDGLRVWATCPSEP